jgi:ferredoxin-thioredoxin reductase catalytic subunit
MSETTEIPEEQVAALYERLSEEAEAGGYHLNPDRPFTMALVESLLINEGRYGYWACPCRLATGNKQEDLDIICPCDYRDVDLLDWGNCYCALYVSQEVLRGDQQPRSIPERRPPEGERGQDHPAQLPEQPSESALPVWRCRVCGYLCARDRPPGVCPICRAKQDRFERFW